MEVLSYFLIAVLFLVAFSAALAVVICFSWLLTNPVAGAALVLVIFLLEVVFVSLPAINVGFNIFPGDIASLALGIVAVIRIGKVGRLTTISSAWLVLGLVLFISFTRGMSRYGVSAGSDFRTYFFYFWTGVAYFLTFDLTESQLYTIAKLWIAVCLCTMALVYFRWGADAAGLKIGPSWSQVGAGVPFRVVGAGAAMVLAVGLLILVHQQLCGQLPRHLAILPLFLLFTLLLLQHRTVWVAALTGLITLFMTEKGHRTKGVVKVTVAGLVVVTVIVIAALYGSLDMIGNTVDQSFHEAFSDRSTFTGRIEGWQELVGEWSRGDLAGYLIGSPFGSGYARVQQGGVVTWTPHNYYLQTLLRTGVIGVFALIAVYGVGMYRLLWTESEPISHGPLFFALLAMELAYFIPYPALFEQSIFSGVAFCVVARAHQRRVRGIGRDVTLGRNALVGKRVA